MALHDARSTETAQVSRAPLRRPPALAPASDLGESTPAAHDGDTCLCGRAEFDRCCYPVALRLRSGRADRRLPPSPFDQLRASGALMLWGLTAGPMAETTRPTARVRRSLSSAARRFWGTIASLPSVATTAPPDAGSPYGAALFDRTWCGADEGTRTWLLSTLPPGLRHDPVVGELAVDWLLWDAPWLAGEPAATWFLHTRRSTTGPRTLGVIRSLLRSRPGLYRLAGSDPPPSPLPQRPVLELADLLGGPCVRVDTPTPAWPDPERSLLVRTYRFRSWRLAAGEGLLLAPETASRLLDDLERDRRHQGVPGWPDPRRERWLKGRLLPLAAAVWCSARASSGVVRDTSGRYDGLSG